MKAAGKDPMLLVPPQLRPLLARYARLFAPGARCAGITKCRTAGVEDYGGVDVSIRHWCTTAGCGVNALSSYCSGTIRRPDKRKRIRHQRTTAGCGVSALSGLPIQHRFVGMMRRVSITIATCT
ncbi:hypothetical protein ACLB1N_17005 [Escherichia coli]